MANPFHGGGLLSGSMGSGRGGAQDKRTFGLPRAANGIRFRVGAAQRRRGRIGFEVSQTFPKRTKSPDLWVDKEGERS